MSGCRICDQPLVVELDPEDFDEATASSAGGAPATVPDDLALPCNCHFHWQCLLDESATIHSTLQCPSCATQLISPTTQTRQILTRYHNEGGLQSSLDIFPLVTEEAYLTAHPSARPARAMLTMASEGDVYGIVDIVRALSEDADEGDMEPAELLRYRDPLDGGKSALHFAVEKGQAEVVWLLLWMASGIESAAFPEEVVAAAYGLGAGREFAAGEDVRGLKDEQERTPGDVAREIGGWESLVGAGML